jgi:hypothetical protein
MCVFAVQDSTNNSRRNQQEGIRDFQIPLFTEISTSENGFCQILYFACPFIVYSMTYIRWIITDQLFCTFKHLPTDQRQTNYINKTIAFTGISTPCPDDSEIRIMQNTYLDIQIQTFRTKDRGYGLKTTNNVIPQGTPIIEYVGKVVSHKMYRTCMERMYKHDSSLYAVAVDDNWVIDAHTFGNLARFVNHSCEPNCVIEAWHAVSSNPKLVITARRDLKSGEELTFDYNTRSFNPLPRTVSKFLSMFFNNFNPKVCDE